MSILFINGSPNKNGNTAKLAAELLNGKDYETLNLTDYTIRAYGQNLLGDGLDTVINAMKQADTFVIGSPLYWQRPQYARPFLWQNQKRRAFRAQAVLCISGCCPGTVDAGSG